MMATLEKESVSEKQIYDVLRDMCIPSNLKGYRYIKTAIKLIYDNYETYDGCLTKTLYPEVAKIHETTSSCAERCIRNAKEYAFNIIPTDITKEIFGTYFLYDQMPSNAEFLYNIVEYLRVMKEEV